MKKSYIFFLPLLFNLLSSGLGAQDNGWKFVKETNGIEVYSRKSDDSPIKEIKVLKVMETTLSSLVALMKDVENHKNWTYANKKAKVLEKQSEFSWIFYGYSDAPWPVQDRDMVLHSTLRQDSVTKVIKNEGECIPNFIPENEDVVRIPACHSIWTLKPLGEGKVLVSLEIQIDLGGSIPNWLINLVSSKGPYLTIKNMEEAVKKAPYKNVVLDYIKD